MKNSKSIRYIALAAVLLFTLAACKKDKPFPVEISGLLPGPGEVVIATAGQSYTYRYDDGAFTSANPIDWENLSGDSHRFDAIYTPDADGTPEKDILTGYLELSQWGTPLQFKNFTPVNAYVTISVNWGANPPGTPSDTKITFAGVASPDYTATGTSVTAVLAPKKVLALNDKVTIALGRFTYEIDLSQELLATGATGPASLEGGKTYTVSRTFSDADNNLIVGLPDEPGALKVAVWKTGEEPAYYDYAWDGRNLSSALPFEWYHLAMEGSYNFEAEFVPEAPGKPVKEYRKGLLSDVPWGKTIDFGTLERRVAVLNLRFDFGDDLPGDISTAVITFNQYVVQGSYTVTGSLETTAVLWPTTLTDDAIVNITIGPFSYDLQLNKAYSDGKLLTQLEAGGLYTVVEEFASETFAFDLPQVPGTVIISVNGTEYTYRFDGEKLTSDNPFSWYNLPHGQAYDFNVRFIPDEGSPEKDILIGEQNGIEWGGLVDFSSLAHENALIGVTLKAGEGVTEADLTQAVMLFSGLSDPAYECCGKTAETVFSPQVFSGSEIISVTAAGYTKTLDLTDVEWEGTPWKALETGKRYDLEITVGKAGLTFSLSVKPWKKASGTGTWE